MATEQLPDWLTESSDGDDNEQTAATPSITSGGDRLPEGGVEMPGEIGYADSQNDNGTGGQAVKRGLAKAIAVESYEIGFKAAQDEDNGFESYLKDAQNFGRGVVQGASFGVRDEAWGVLSGVVGEALELFGVGEEQDFSDRYISARDDSRAEDDAARERSPWLYGSGEVAGAGATMFVPGGALAQGARATQYGARGSQLLGKASQTLTRMGRGAAAGGVQGLGHSRADNAEDLIRDTVQGAAFGAALPVAGKAIKETAKWGADILGPTVNAALAIPAASLKTMGSGMMIPSRILQSTKHRKQLEAVSMGISEKVNAGVKAAKTSKESGFWKRNAAQAFDDMGRLSGIAKSAPTLGVGAVVAAVGSAKGRLFHKVAAIIEDPQAIAEAVRGGPFEKAVMASLERGSEAFQATMYTLMNDPEFRKSLGIDLSETNE